MTLTSLVLSIITGFGLVWNVEPIRGQEGGTVHITVEFRDEDLLFVMGDDDETASWEIAAAIDGEYALRTSGTVEREEMPYSEELTITGLRPGVHVLSIIMNDLETGNSTQWEETVMVPVIDSLSWASGSVQVSGGTYQRAAGSVDLTWNIYQPLAPSIEQDSILAAFVLRDDDGVTEREGWMDVNLVEGILRGEASVDLTDLSEGDYEILVAAVSGEVIVTASRQDLHLLQAWDVWGDDPDMTRTLVRPIANPSELDALDGAEGPASRTAVMAEFWQRRDPTVGTDRNEYLEMYLARLDYVEDKFSMLNIMGITTDQGRVFALLGEPDMIENSPMETASLPTQVWTYFSPPIEVYFVDNDGVGTYELATEWEEVQAIHERHN